jgi:branched-chain amino acid transport system substrate-binding protein
MDTETTPATGSRVAERMITRNECAFLLGAVHSGVANAISQVAQKYGCIYLNTNSSSPTESGKDCHRVKFVWDGNGTNFAHAIVKNAIAVNGKNWVMLTNDYVWGHNTAKATRAIVEANGGRIVEEMMVPQNTRDFSAYLLKIQQIKPAVVATAVGGDDIKALRQQVVQLKLNKTAAWVNNQQDWPDVYGLGPEAIFGVFGTTWYYRLDLPGVKEFVAAYQKQYPGMAIRVPGNVYHNGYMATRELLRCVEEAGTTNNIAVIKKLEGRKMSARDRLQHYDAWIDPATHQCQQTIYMATYNDQPAEKDDIFRILTQAAPADVQDADAKANCKLESYEATPTYEV